MALEWTCAVIPLDYAQGPEGPLAEDVVERFDHFLRVIRRSEDTRRLYVGGVRRWLAAGGRADRIDPGVLQRFLMARRAVLAPASMNVELKALRAFYGWLETLDEAPPGSRAALPRLRKVPQRVPRWLTDAEVGAVLGACALDTFDGLRDYALLLTLYVTGLRSGEIARMETPDLVDYQALFVRGKGGRERWVPLGAQLGGVLDGYLHARAGRRPGKRNAFWVRADGTPLRGRREVWRIVSARIWAGLPVARGLGVEAVRGCGKPWSGHYPHELRASFATALLHRGAPLTAIAQLMGHADVATTAHYLGVDGAHLRAAMACHPRAFRADRA